MNQSENTLQSLAATNCTSDVQECTRVHYFVRRRTLFKRRKIFQLVRGFSAFSRSLGILC